jgi:cleavage stimulation factor subunit 2
MRVIAMTPDQINMLPPTERASIIQLVKNISLISLDLIVLI